MIFVGAGVSRLMGCPSWGELADKCLAALAANGLITYGDIEQLGSLDQKKKLTIAMQVAEAAGKPLDLPTLLRPSRATTCRVYEFLNRIGCAYVTTNYDQYLDQEPVIASDAKQSADSTAPAPVEPELICRPDQLSPQCLRATGSVVHLHGSVVHPETMVITTPDYLRHYEDERVKTFLSDLFDRYTVLFVGYGLEEWEVLEHILRKGGPQASRFLLTGYFSHQLKTYEHLKVYYERSFDVVLVPFDRDARDHRQLETVLEDWSERLEIGDPLIADDLAFVLEAANE